MKLLIALLLASGSAMAADDAPFFRCRDISDDSKRLACYDAVQRPTPAQVRQVQEKSFGLGAKSEGEQLAEIESYVPGRFEGWEGNQHITLANGQVWQVKDDSTGAVMGNNLKAKITRGMFGATYLEIEGSGKAARVKRVK